MRLVKLNRGLPRHYSRLMRASWRTSSLVPSSMVLEHRGYGAYIKCGDGPLEEFAVTEEDESTLMCYICSEPGKVCQFHISWCGTKYDLARIASFLKSTTKTMALWNQVKMLHMWKGNCPRRSRSSLMGRSLVRWLKNMGNRGLFLVPGLV